MRTFLFISLLLLSLGALPQNAEIILDEVKCTVLNNVLNSEYHKVIQINSQQGISLAKIKLRYEADAPIQGLEAYITDTNGVIIRKLKKKEIRKANAISWVSLYEDSWKLEFELIHNTYPYRVMYKYYTREKNFISISYWSPVKQPEVPVRFGRIQLIMPENYKVNVYNVGCIQKETKLPDGQRVLYWQVSYNGKLRHQIMPDSYSNYMPTVYVVPESFNYGVPGRQNSWVEFGNWIDDLNEGLNDMPQQEVQLLESITAECKTERDKVKAIYKHLQTKHRYISVQVGVGGFRPFPPSYVVNHRYGDCKALSFYMKSALEAVGVKSNYCLVDLDDEINNWVKENFPASWFNHAILCVPNSGDTIWLECTSQSNPVGYIHSGIQGRKALIVEKDASHLAQIPAMTSETATTQNVYHLTLDNNDALVEANCETHGYNYELFNSLSTYLNRKQQEDFIIKKVVPVVELDTWEVNKTMEDSAIAIFRWKGIKSNYLKKMGNDILLSPLVVKIPDLETPQERCIPLQRPFPLCVTDSIILNLPQNETWQLNTSKNKIENRAGFFSQESVVKDNKLFIYRTLHLSALTVLLEEYPEYYKDYLEIKNQLNQYIHLKKVQ